MSSKEDGIAGTESGVDSWDEGDGYSQAADLPEPHPLRRTIGPSLVLLAVSMGSGEFVLWPFVSSRAGLGLLWVALVGLLTQYFVNMEIERYTLATGETAITGFTRMWKPWAWIFMLFVALPWVWPGWAAGASTIAGFLFGWGPSTVTIVAVLGLVSIGIALSLSPVVFRVVERVQWVMVGWVVLFIAIGGMMATEPDVWATIITDVGFQLHPDLSPTLVLGLLVFAGAGGSLNLALSNWVRDKGMGMGAHFGAIESPVTGHPAAAAPLGRPFAIDDENMRRWRGWWRVANLEQFLFFFLLGFVVIAALSALSASSVFGLELGGGFDFIRAEGQALGEIVGPWFRSFFWITGAVILFATNLGILDHLGRLIADIVKVSWLAENEFWSESKLYFVVVWIVILVSSGILFLGFDEPLPLMVLSAAMSAVVMFVYSALLIRLNRSALPGTIRLRGLRFWAMVWSVALFGGFSFFVVLTGVVPLVARIGGG